MTLRFMCSHPFARQPLRLDDLSGRHLGGNVIALFDRSLASVVAHFDRHFARGIVSARHRQVEPHMSADIVLRHSLAVGVHHAEVVLRAGVALVGSLAKPCDGLRVILGHSLAIGISQAVVDRAGAARRLPRPSPRPRPKRPVIRPRQDAPPVRRIERAPNGAPRGSRPQPADAPGTKAKDIGCRSRLSAIHATPIMVRELNQAIALCPSPSLLPRGCKLGRVGYLGSDTRGRVCRERGRICNLKLMRGAISSSVRPPFRPRLTAF